MWGSRETIIDAICLSLFMFGAFLDLGCQMALRRLLEVYLMHVCSLAAKWLPGSLDAPFIHFWAVVGTLL